MNGQRSLERCGLERQTQAGAFLSGPTVPLLCAVLWLVLGAGCKLTRPHLASTGTAEQQQMRATQYDPYAYNDVAPEIVGGRPREFAKQTPEPVRVDNGSPKIRWPF